MKMEWGFWVCGCVLLIRLGHIYRLAMLWLGFGRQSSAMVGREKDSTKMKINNKTFCLE